MFRYLTLLFVSLSLFSTASLADDASVESAAPIVEAPLDPNSKNAMFSISDGSRIDLEGKDFSIIPPTGWEVHTAYPNTTLLMQVPFKAGQAYQRTIQVMRFAGAVPIDEITAAEFEEIIEQKFSKASRTITDYRIRNHMITELEDKSPGILFYSEFTLEGHALMQAHILLSSSDHRFLVTYTDLASHFEGEEASEFLTEAWSSIVTVHLNSTPPMRLRQPVIMGFAIGFMTLFVLLFLAVRKYRAGREYGDLVGDPYDEKKESYLHTGGVSKINSHVTGKQPNSFKVESKEVELDESDEDNEGSSWNLSAEHDEEDKDLSEFGDEEADPKAS